MSEARKFPVSSLTTPGGMSAQDIAQFAGGVQSAPGQAPMMDPAAFNELPGWAIHLMNTQRLIQAEMGALMLAIQRRGLVTQQELAEARAMVDKEAESQFRQAIEQLGRQFSQQPLATDPAATLDPRKNV